MDNWELATAIIPFLHNCSGPVSQMLLLQQWMKGSHFPQQTNLGGRRSKSRCSNLSGHWAQVVGGAVSARSLFLSLQGHPCGLMESSKEAEKAHRATSDPGPCEHTKSLQSCPTLCDPIDCSPPGSSVHRILQARIPEWVAMLSSRGSS